MKRQMLGALVVALVLAIGVLVTRAYAQMSEGTHDMPMVTSMMENCPMMGAMARGPEAALRHQEELGLTNEQVQDLETLAERNGPARSAVMQQMRALHAEIDDASSGEIFDEAAVRRAFDRMGRIHGEMGVAMLRMGREVREILTPAQQETFGELAGQMNGMMGMMMNGMGGMGDSEGMAGMEGMMMEDCPMMSGSGHGDDEEVSDTSTRPSMPGGHHE